MIARRLAALDVLCAGWVVAAQVAAGEPERARGTGAAPAIHGERSRRSGPRAHRQARAAVAGVGAVRVSAPMQAFFARVRDITHFRSGPESYRLAGSAARRCSTTSCAIKKQMEKS